MLNIEATEKFLLNKADTIILIVDVQERLAAVMEEREKVSANCLHLIELAKMLDIPVLLTEQYPKGLGPTVPEIKDAVPVYQPSVKLAFGCCEDPDFTARMKSMNRERVVLAGMETHICVLQTAVGLLREGYNVHLVRDAVCSRTRENREAGIEFMRQAGAVITCTETVLFQLLKVAGTEEFKAVSKRIK